MGGGATDDSVLAQLHKDGSVALVQSFCLDSQDSKGSNLVLGRGPAPASMTTMPLYLSSDR